MIRAPSGISAIAASREFTIFCFIRRSEVTEMMFPKIVPDQRQNRNSNRFNPKCSDGLGWTFTTSSTYWTDVVDPSTPSADPSFNLLTPDGKNAPAPWVPFTRAGCNVGAVSIANMELENTQNDITTVWNAGASRQRNAGSPGANLLEHCNTGMHSRGFFWYIKLPARRDRVSVLSVVPPNVFAQPTLLEVFMSWVRISEVFLLAVFALFMSGCAVLTSSSGFGSVAPSITAQPASATVTVGQAATFSLGATGALPLNYQWRKNGASISGATGSSYTTPATTSTDNGAKFDAVVSNTAGSMTSNAVSLTVTPAGVTLRSIAVTPASPSIVAGNTQQFTATGTYSDNSTKDIASTVTCKSSSTSFATIGAATGLAAGGGA